EAKSEQGIERLHLSDGHILEADFDIDATGPVSRLLGEALSVPFKEETRIGLWPTRMSARVKGKLSWQPFASIRRESTGWIRTVGLQGHTVVEGWFSVQVQDEFNSSELERIFGSTQVRSVTERHGL